MSRRSDRLGAGTGSLLEQYTRKAHGGVRGRLGRHRAKLVRLDGDRLVLRCGGKRFDLGSAIVRHRDDEGRVEFSITDGETEFATRYPRKGPTRADRAWDAIDFTADEPWSWEDSDFGLFVFHVATGTGPIKYRHRLQPRSASNNGMSPRRPVLSATDVRRDRTNARSERVQLRDLVEVRAKFEVAGIWSPATLLVLYDTDDVVTVPVYLEDDVTWIKDNLVPVLSTLPGWREDNETQLARALDYACRRAVGPGEGETINDWAETPIWARAQQ